MLDAAAANIETNRRVAKLPVTQQAMEAIQGAITQGKFSCNFSCLISEWDTIFPYLRSLGYKVTIHEPGIYWISWRLTD